MQGGEGRLNVVHLTAAQVTNTGVGSKTSAPSTRLPPMLPTSSPRGMTISSTNSSHMPMKMAHESEHITVSQQPIGNISRENMQLTTMQQHDSPPMPLTSSPRGMIISSTNSSHMPMKLAHESEHITVLQQPIGNMSRENMQLTTMQQHINIPLMSTSSLGSVRQIPPTPPSSASSLRDMIPPATSPRRDTNMNDVTPTQSSIEEQQRSSAQRRPATSSIRKRSRMHEENVFIKDGISRQKEDGVKIYEIDVMLQNLHAQVEQALIRGDKGKGTTIRLNITESFDAIGCEICHIMTKNMNLQEENRAAQQQIVQLQNQMLAAPRQNYLGALMQPPTINKMLPTNTATMHIPTPVRHAPAEKIIIFRAEKKGEKMTKEQQNKFRVDIQQVLGEKIMSEVEVIRPTRNGGHIVIFQHAESRDDALKVFRDNEMEFNIPLERSCMMAPKKRYAKVVCRDPPDDVTPEEVMEDMYSKRNMYLHMIAYGQREAKITVTRFGWIFDLSGEEAVAIQAQGERIRFGIAKELLVEEYIPIQQCYNCCIFGHSAKFCQMERPYCRLCGDVGHAGWDCPHKENKLAWKCANCIITNETKGTKYPINHAAAQLHKCPCALSHRSIRKAQLSAEGIFTFPDVENTGIFINKGEPIHTNAIQSQNGIRQMTGRRKNRSRSFQQRFPMYNSNKTSASSASSTAMGVTTSSTTSNKGFSMGNWETQRKEAYLARTVKPMRPRSFDAWKNKTRYNNQGESSEELRGRDFIYQMQGTNSVTSTQMSNHEIQRPIQMTSQMYDG